MAKEYECPMCGTPISDRDEDEPTTVCPDPDCGVTLQLYRDGEYEGGLPRDLTHWHLVPA